METVPVVVVGAGQAGLATSRELGERGIEHVVLERGRVAQTWRGRWDSFCLVTPNWSVRLPDGGYDGPDPDGFMGRDELVRHVETYAKNVAAPVREGVDVLGLERNDDDFLVRTSDGDIRGARVVLATGAYQRPHRPAFATDLPSGVLPLDVDGYTNPEGLPPGRVLIVGSGQSGCQIAEELHDAGREVVLSCGRAPWLRRRFGDRDMFWWACRNGFIEQPVETLPDPAARLWANPTATGHGGGRDLHVRLLSEQGVTLAGRLRGVSGSRAVFAPDLAASVAWGDERYRQFGSMVERCAKELGVDVPEIPRPEPFTDPGIEELDLRGVAAVLFAGGFRPDYRSWLPWADAFDEHGFPIHRDGESAVVPGLFFVGVHFLRTRKSSLLYGVGEDAAMVAGAVAAY
ncbi:MAG TPA: NAD(P)-binding domain-containing protein [Actinomycetota bacterium]|nr:NAD(P)-binding domain-containing protein [Actinomycetota bacterium]